MKRTTKYRLMSSVLTTALIISGLKQVVYASTIVQSHNQPSSSYNNNKVSKQSPRPSLEEYINSLETSQLKKFYTRLYELYDYETFPNRSIIPQYFQTIYGDKFSCGTIQSAGCGISSLSMITSYLYDEIITPDLMAKYDNGPSPASALEKAIKKLNLNCETIYGQKAIDILDEALDAGHPIIGLYGPSSLFTGTGHFVVLAGKTHSGKYIVNDPNLENFYQPYLVEGFTNGFTREQITRGLRGIYIFDTKKDFIDTRNRKLEVKTPPPEEPATKEQNTIGYTIKETELKSSPEVKSSTIENLKLNTGIIRLVSNINGYDLVKTNNHIGYINSKETTYNEDTKINSQSYIRHIDIVVSISNVELKQLPNDKSPILESISTNTPIETIAILENNWLLVSYNNQIGYIKSTKVVPILSKIQYLYPELQLSQIRINKIVSLTTKTDIRMGNDIEFDSIGTIEKNSLLPVLGEYNNWYLVYTDNFKIGFIPKRFTKSIESPLEEPTYDNDKSYTK